MSVFQASDFLIPAAEALPDWAVIACDQFTSQPEYWREVRARVGGKPSAYALIFPEAELGGDEDARIASINAAMRETLASDVLRRHPACFVYVERTLLDSSIRRGVVGVIDLEAYDYRREAESPIRATEQTVLERIPPRVKIRRDAPMELSHVMLLMDDRSGAVLDTLEKRREALPTLYDFALMQGGGQIVGRLVAGRDAEDLAAAVAEYEKACAARCRDLGCAPLLYAVGDGNHSLAAAKSCWESRKAAGAGPDSPARFAMVELQNIHDASQRFEPIHRIVTGIDENALLRDLEGICAEGGCPVTVCAGEEERVCLLDRRLGELPVAILQPFLDRWLQEHGGRIDYIHGDEVARTLAKQPHAAAFLLPNIAKEDFFRGISLGGVLPRKTFSMGHAPEKRYYLEARKIAE